MSTINKIVIALIIIVLITLIVAGFGYSKIETSEIKTPLSSISHGS